MGMTVAQLEAEFKQQMGFAGTAVISDLTDAMLLSKLNQAAAQVCNDVPLLHRVATIAMTTAVAEYALPSDVLSISHNSVEIISSDGASPPNYSYNELTMTEDFTLREKYGAGWRRNSGYIRHYYRIGQTVGIWPAYSFTTPTTAVLSLDCVIKPDSTITPTPFYYEMNSLHDPDWCTEPMALVWYCVREYCLTQLATLEAAQQKATYANGEYQRLVKQMLSKLVL
jgi:hypothetical protein